MFRICCFPLLAVLALTSTQALCAGKDGDLVAEVRRLHGEDGELALEVFGAGAGRLWEKDRPAFARLVSLMARDPQRETVPRKRRIAQQRWRLLTRDWKPLVLDLAQSGQLPAFLRQLDRLPDDRLSIAGSVPAALSLLCVEKTPTAHAMLEKHGARVWHLFSHVDFHTRPQDVERVAEAVKARGELVLDLNEAFGPWAALLLVAPATKTGSRHLPTVAVHALKKLERPVALTLLLANHRDLVAQLDEGKSVRDLCDAIDLFRTQSPLIQELAAEHDKVIRLLTEHVGGEAIGATVLAQVGPQATRLVYDHYPNPERKRVALFALGQVGPPAFTLLHKQRDDADFAKLLDRLAKVQNEEDGPGLIARAISTVATGTRKASEYVQVENLAGQLRLEAAPPRPNGIEDWLPLYSVWEVLQKSGDGLIVSRGDLFWAGVDAVDFLATVATLPVGGTGGAAVKAGGVSMRAATKGGTVVATQLGKQAIRQGEKAAARTLLAAAREGTKMSYQKWLKAALEKSTKDFGKRFAKEAEAILIRRLNARVSGVLMEGTGSSGDFLDGLPEELLGAAIQTYARGVGYHLLGSPGKTSKFSALARDGDRAKLIVSDTSIPRGKKSEDLMKSALKLAGELAEQSRAAARSVQEKETAASVLSACKEGRLDVEVVEVETRGRDLFLRVVHEEGSGGTMLREIAHEANRVFSHGPASGLTWVRMQPELARERTLTATLEHAAPVARQLGLRLRVMGGHPLVPHTSTNAEGRQTQVWPAHLIPTSEMRKVGPLATSLMKWGLSRSAAE